MYIYLKSNNIREMLLDYQFLAEKMWFKERDNRKLDISYSGYTGILKNNPTISLRLNNWVHDKRWLTTPKKESEDTVSLNIENISLEYEKKFISDEREKGDHLRFISTHKDLLTVDKRAMYIMVIEVATAIDGLISEDDKVTWINIDDFKKRHADILSLSFDEANEISLEEIVDMEPIEEPLWDELDKQREEYIKIHGERVYDDEDDEFDDDDEDHEYWDYDEETGELIRLNLNETHGADENDDNEEEVFGF